MIAPRHISANDRIIFEKVNLNHNYYFFKYIKNIDTSWLNIEIKYIMMQNINNQNIDRGISLCLSFSDVDAYIIDENEN